RDGRPRRQVRVDYVSSRYGRDRSDVSSWSRTRSSHFPYEVERSDGGGTRGIFRTLPRLYCNCALRSPLDDKIELVSRCGALHNLCRGRLRCYVRTWT